MDNQNNKTGTQDKGMLAVIGIEIPSPKWINEVPLPCGVVFGRHYAQTDRLGKNLLGTCEGKVELCAVGKNEIIGYSKGEAIEIRCPSCGFSHVFAESWREAVLEWMRISFNLAMDTIFNCAGPEDNDKDDVYGMASSNIKICVPDYPNRLHAVPPTPERPKWMDQRVLVFEEYGIAVYTKLDLDIKKLRSLLINSALLMTDIEQTFQNAIKRSAQLACSASEPYHFDTRRKR